MNQSYVYPERAAQQKRRDELAALVSDTSRDYYDETGACHSPDDGVRERLFNCLAFLQNGRPQDVRLANAIIRKALPGYRLCHFSPYLCCQILLHFEPLLEGETVRVMEDYIRAHLDSFLSEELDFVACNDNFPCMSTALTLFAGARFGRADCLETAKKRMNQMCAQLERRGFTAEFCSPTYTPIQAAVLAEIARFSPDETIARQALQAEQRVLADLLMHMHWKTAQLAGPHSRAYPVDLAGCSHHARFLYWALYGDELTVSPVEAYFGAETGKGVAHHSGPHFLRISFMWQLMSEYHCPKALWELPRSRRKPCVVAGTAESICANDPGAEGALCEHPPRGNSIYTYMTADYALGTARYVFHNGTQTNTPCALYARADARSQSSVGTLFTRYVVNEEPLDMIEGSGKGMECGRKICFQNGPLAVAAYTPRPTLTKAAASLRLSAVLPVLGKMPDEIYLGERRLTDACGESASPEPVFVRDGAIFIALMPLRVTDCGRSAAVRVEKRERRVEMSFVNYEGAPRDFAPEEALEIDNGLAVFIQSEAEAGDFESFRRRAGVYALTDYRMWGTAMRRIILSFEGSELETVYSPRSLCVRHVSINGRLMPEPKLYASDWDVSHLPLNAPEMSLAELCSID